MPAAMTALATVTLGSAASTVTFGSIPATYRDLRLVINWGLTGSSDNIATFRLNGDTANYSSVDMIGDGSTPQSNSRTDNALFLWRGTLDATIKSVSTVDIMDYSATDKHKSVLVRTSSPAMAMALAGRWASTSAVTSITLLPWTLMSTPGSFTAGSTFSLYGISA